MSEVTQINLSRSDVAELRRVALSYWAHLPHGTLDDGTPVQNETRNAVAWLNSCLSFLHSRALCGEIYVAINTVVDETL